MFTGTLIGAVIFLLAVVALSRRLSNTEVAINALRERLIANEKVGTENYVQLHGHEERLRLLDGKANGDPYRSRLKLLEDGEVAVVPGPRICMDCRFVNPGKNAAGPICLANPHKDGGGYQFCALVNAEHDCALFQPKSRKPPADPPPELPPPRVSES